MNLINSSICKKNIFRKNQAPKFKILHEADKNITEYKNSYASVTLLKKKLVHFFQHDVEVFFRTTQQVLSIHCT